MPDLLSLPRRKRDVEGLGKQLAHGVDPHALEALREDTRGWWAQALGDDESDSDAVPYVADADGLRRFLEGAVMPHHHERRREIERRPLIVSQAHGEAFDPIRFATLGRYETHLDRKFEKTLAMLLKLKDLRPGS